MENKAHSPLGASGMKRWMTCAGSYALALKAPWQRPSIYAATGTLAHKIAEDALIVGFEPHLALGDVVTVEGYEITVDQEMVDGVQMYLDTVIARCASPGVHVSHEIQVSLNAWWQEGLRKNSPPPPVDLFGTADTAIVDPAIGTLSIVDFKYGAGMFVAVEDNPQLIYYAAGVALKVAQNAPALYPKLKEIELVVVQPRAQAREKVRVARMDMLDLWRWIDDTLIPAVAAVTDPAAPLVPGQHCHFCPAATFCPALQERRQASARREFLGPLSDEELRLALDDAENIEIWVKHVRDEATRRIEQEHNTALGWALVPTRPTRVWDDEDMLLPLLPNGAVTVKPLSPAQLEKQFPKVWHTVKEHVVSRSGGTKLARVNTP
jgi:hypothetical protein